MSTRRVNRTRLQKRCKEYDEAKERGETYGLDIPTDAPIAQGFKRTRQTESEGLQKLFDVAYYVATKGRPLSDFESLIELEKLHGVSFHGTKYENRNACRDFVLSIYGINEESDEQRDLKEHDNNFINSFLDVIGISLRPNQIIRLKS